MSKELTVIEGLVQQTSTQSQALQAVLTEIKQDKKEMHQMKRDVVRVKDEVKKLADEVESDVFLKPAQANELYDSVARKGRELTKEYYPSLIGSKEYPKRVGVARIKIWAQFKRAYGVAKYFYLPRKYYESAMNWVQNIDELDGFGE